MEKEKIKKDLRTLRKITHSIEVALACKKNHENRIEYLKQSKQTPERVAEIKRLEMILSNLHIEDAIRKASVLEEVYVSAIDKLEPLDKTIIIDGYINGKAYWKIGRDIGYTEAGIRKRLEKAIDKLSDIL